MKFSTTQIEISGLNLERKLNILNKQGIKIVNVTRLSRKRCIVTVPHAFKKQAIDLLSQKCYNEDGTEGIVAPKSCDFGLAYFWNLAKRHMAIALCIVLIVPMLWFSSMFCWKIDVQSSLAYEQVENCLKEFGIAVGKPFGNVNINQLSNFLCNELDVSYASVGIRGSVLYVQLVDRVDFDDTIDLTKKHDVVAKYSGVITRMSVVQGTPLVKVGDRVEKGQMLIEGKRTFNDGTTEDVRAIGTVFATVEVSAFSEYCQQQTKLVKTGNVFFRTVVQIGKITSSFKDIPFEHFEIEQKTTSLSPVNVTIVNQTVYELAEVVESIPFALAVLQLKQTALEKALQLAYFVPHTTEYFVEEGVGVTVTLLGEIVVS